MENWRSPLLGVRFSTSEGDLVLFHPDGERFVEFVEVVEQRDRQKQRANLAEHERDRERLEKELEKQRADRERQEKEQTQAVLEEERKKNQQLRDRLIQLGIDPENLS